MNQDRIFLIGLPGSGKTSLGQSLADKLQLSFFDLDQCIEESELRTISEIFSQSGENYFRQVETKELEQLIQKNNRLILSTGGGTPCFNRNMEFMNHSGTTIYLDVPLEVLAGRLMHSQIERPMFKGLNREAAYEKLSELLRLRQSFYQQATVTVTGGSIEPESILKRLR